MTTTDVTPSSRHTRRSCGQFEQSAGGRGQRAVAVEPLVAQVVELVDGRHARESAVGLESRVVGLDVLLGQVRLARARRG